VGHYGAPGGFPSPEQGAALGGGNFFFAGGTNAARSYREQQILVPAEVQEDVNAGNVELTIGGCLGGYAAQDDSVDIHVDSYLNARDPAGPEVTVQGPLAADRGDQTALLPRVRSVPLERGTEIIDVQLDFQRTSGPGTYTDGSADTLLLALTVRGAPTPSPSCGDPAPSGGNPGGGGGGNPGSGTAPGGGGTTPAAPFLVKTSATSARLSGSGATVGVPLTCDGHDSPCAGTVSLTVPSLPHASSVKLGATSFSIAPGSTRTIRVRLGRSAKKRLSSLSSGRLRRLRVSAKVTMGS